MSSLLNEMRDKWIARRDELGKLAATVLGAALCEEVLADLEVLLKGEASEILTIGGAAKRSGYSADHIGRLIREGKLTNVGRKHAPRVLACELPRRPASRLAASHVRPYDANTDARSLRVRR